VRNGARGRYRRRQAPKLDLSLASLGPWKAKLPEGRAWVHAALQPFTDFSAYSVGIDRSHQRSLGPTSGGMLTRARITKAVRCRGRPPRKGAFRCLRRVCWRLSRAGPRRAHAQG
jgi:hypothetical protein